MQITTKFCFGLVDYKVVLNDNWSDLVKAAWLISV